MRTSLLAAFAFFTLASAAPAQPIRPMVGRLQTVTVEDGNLLPLALRHRLAIEHLAFANGYPVTTVTVPPGTKLVLPTWHILPANPPRNGIVVNLPERGAYLFRNGRFDRFYPLSIGDEVLEKGRFHTRTGSFRIIEKEVNPTWYPPEWAKDRKPVGPGKNNPLGDRWIGLSLNRTGIHGTNDPYNIGNSVTHGCMRTYPQLVRELYDRVQVGWPVRIEYEVVKVGRGPGGKLYMATYPDVYRRDNTLKRSLATMNRLGLWKRVKRRNFKDVLALCMGVPIRLDGSETVAEEVGLSQLSQTAQP